MALAPTRHTASACPSNHSPRAHRRGQRWWLHPLTWFALVLAASTPLLAAEARAATIELRVAASTDDAEEGATGSMYVNSSDLELTHDATDQVVGLRWAGLSIPPGASITAAWIQFTAKELQSEVTALSLYAQAADNAAAFTTSRSNVSLRARSAASVSWQPAAWSGVGQAGAAQRTPDVSALVQEVVNRPGWVSGNALAIIVTGTGHRTAYARDGSATLAPLLHVEYTTGAPPPDLPPVASLAATVLADPPLTVSASGAASTDTDLTPIASYRFDFGDGTPAVVTTAPTSSATHTYAAEGTYTITLIVTDTGLNASAPVTQSVTVSNSTTVLTMEKRIAVSSDDAEQQPSGSVSLSSSDLELVHDSADQIVGLRWPGILIPRGASITKAWIQFTAKEAQSEVTSLTLRAQAADNAATFTTASGNVTSRPTTSAAITWAPQAWTVGAAGASQRTPNIAALVQEVVNRGGWASGNAIAMVIRGTGHRTAWAFNGSATRAPLLHIEYVLGPPPPDQPPVAALSLAQLPAPAFTVRADASGSTDDDATPIASYRFDFGDGSPPVTTIAPTATAVHTYAAAGTYTVTLVATDTGLLSSAPVSTPITVIESPASGLAVYVGYYDTHHPDNPQPKPDPWMGSPGITFVGTPDSPSGGWDSSGLRLDNLGTTALTDVVVTCDMGSHHFALWGPQSIPAGGTLVLAQTAFENFDGSDTNPAGCFGCDPSLCLTQVQSTVPVVHVTIGGVTTDYFDTGQILNTHGVDAAGCPPTSGRLDESHAWQQIFTTPGPASAMSSSGPFAGRPVERGRLALGRPYPNPVHGELHLGFVLPQRGRVHMGVYDVAGRLVRTSVNHELPAGEYRQVVNMAGLKAGVYFCRLATAQGTIEKPVVVR